MRSVTTQNRAKITRYTWLSFTQAIKASFPFILFLTALLPRVINFTGRTAMWHHRSIAFIKAISERDWSATMLATHPGVPTMWLGGLAHWFGTVFITDFNRQILQQMTVEIIPFGLIISLLILLAHNLLRLIFDRQIAAVAALLLALDPFHITLSRTLHVDALMSVFAMISALYMLMLFAPSLSGSDRWRYILLSGIFAGLAILTKSPAYFLLPYFLLCLFVWQGALLLASKNSAMTPLFKWQNWRQPTLTIGRTFLVWLLALVIIYFILWPAMWLQPVEALASSFNRTYHHVSSPHPNPIFFLGQTAIRDPGLLFYPVNILIKTTIVTLPFFIVGLSLLFNRRLERRQRIPLWLMVAFILFFIVQMSLGDKKSTRYTLPAFQFLIIVSGVGAVGVLRWLFGKKRWLFNSALFLVVAIQFIVSIPHHPYYGTTYNHLLGGSKWALGNGIVVGQEQEEGIAIAADYLNRLPDSSNKYAAAQGESFSRHFWGHTDPLDANYLDYLVFTRNHVVRGMNADLWDRYQNLQPEFVVMFEDIPYVWVHKARTKIARAEGATIGEDFRLLGYDLWPAQAYPGETVRLTLYWEAVHKSTGNYTVFTHLFDSTGQMQGQKDNQPQFGAHPTNLWEQGELVKDKYEITLATDAPPGNYQIAIGMYTLETLERLPVTNQDGVPLPDDRLAFTGLQVLTPTQPTQGH
ncbi:MAG: phospholipid carrier-dependent glycosyltransferase [Chloroflexi bacterium]|nr:phospholipid carrier-dependent glycosyltransferase [Chloroflexota bacterium]